MCEALEYFSVGRLLENWTLPLGSGTCYFFKHVIFQVLKKEVGIDLLFCWATWFSGAPGHQGQFWFFIVVGEMLWPSASSGSKALRFAFWLSRRAFLLAVSGHGQSSGDEGDGSGQGPSTLTTTTFVLVAVFSGDAVGSCVVGVVGGGPGGSQIDERSFNHGPAASYHLDHEAEVGEDFKCFLVESAREERQHYPLCGASDLHSLRQPSCRGCVGVVGQVPILSRQGEDGLLDEGRGLWLAQCVAYTRPCRALLFPLDVRQLAPLEAPYTSGSALRRVCSESDCGSIATHVALQWGDSARVEEWRSRGVAGQQGC